MRANAPLATGSGRTPIIQSRPGRQAGRPFARRPLKDNDADGTTNSPHPLGMRNSLKSALVATETSQGKAIASFSPGPIHVSEKLLGLGGNTRERKRGAPIVTLDSGTQAPSPPGS